MRSKTTYILLGYAVALLIIAGGGFAVLMLMTSPHSRTSLSPAIGGPFALTASDGRTISDQTYRGEWLLIYFGYTSCPDACPTALNDMGVALDRLGAEAAALQPVFITVDPKRDTREMLSEYLKSFDPRIVALTGNEEQITGVIKEYRVFVAAHQSGDSNYLVDHSNYFYLINPEGKFVHLLPGDLAGEGIAEQLRRLMKPGS